MHNPNKELVLSIFEDLSAGRYENFMKKMADDICYTITGSSPFSGAHTKQQWLDEVVQPLKRVLEGSIKIQVLTIVAEGEWVCTRSQGQARAKDGRPYNHMYAHFWRVEDSKVAEIWEWLDTELTTAVIGNR
ncbi:MAG: nuclear transport factor 2 family protein [Acidobacteria bacterium]|nr:nuclear transport factor 2 family protein [Acidobacteriota bacterium]